MASKSSAQVKEEVPRVSGANEVYSALVRGLSEMERKGADRVVLTMYELNPSENVTGHWNLAEESNYYPFAMLDETEQEMIGEPNITQFLL